MSDAFKKFPFGNDESVLCVGDTVELVNGERWNLVRYEWGRPYPWIGKREGSGTTRFWTVAGRFDEYHYHPHANDIFRIVDRPFLSSPPPTPPTMTTHTYSIALPALPEEYAYALDPATGCVVYRAPKQEEPYVSQMYGLPREEPRLVSLGDGVHREWERRFIVIKAPKGYRFQRDEQGKPLYAFPKEGEEFLSLPENCFVTPKDFNGVLRAVRDWHCNPRYILEKLPEPIPAPPEGFEWVYNCNGNRIQGTPAPGEYGISTQARVCGANVVVGSSCGNPIPFTCYLLKKIKPSYTEAVKAAGFNKWPFNPIYRRCVYTKVGILRIFSGNTVTLEVFSGRAEGTYPCATVDFKDELHPSLLPPRLADDYEWHETLLCIDDFEV